MSGIKVESDADRCADAIQTVRFLLIHNFEYNLPSDQCQKKAFRNNIRRHLTILFQLTITVINWCINVMLRSSKQRACNISFAIVFHTALVSNIVVLSVIIGENMFYNWIIFFLHRTGWIRNVVLVRRFIAPADYSQMRQRDVRMNNIPSIVAW